MFEKSCQNLDNRVMKEQTTYSIGAVSRLLGVSTHSLRKWEERHGAVHPARSAGGDRRYTSADLDRLSRLKALVDQGHPISLIASMSSRQLDELVDERPSAGPGRRRAVNIAVIGERLADDLRRSSNRTPNVAVTAAATGAEGLAVSDADAIVVDLGSLGADTRGELSRIRSATGVERIVVAYGYGSIEAAEQLSDSRTALVRRPLNHREFARTLHALVGAPTTAQPELGLPPHRFTRDLLGRMAMISPELACECPRHVGQLLIELTDFELYSAECENTKPHDAAIHNMLRRTAATARALFERALVQLAEAEGIDLEQAESEPRLALVD